MLERDYILEIVGEFVQGLARALGRAVAGEPEGIAVAEAEIAGLLDLEPDVALALSPNSLVTMITLSGIGEETAAYVCYGLDRVALLHERAGNEDLAGLRWLQARAVAESFACEATQLPPEIFSLDEELFGSEGALGAAPSAGEKDARHVG